MAGWNNVYRGPRTPVVPAELAVYPLGGGAFTNGGANALSASTVAGDGIAVSVSSGADATGVTDTQGNTYVRVSLDSTNHNSLWVSTYKGSPGTPPSRLVAGTDTVAVAGTTGCVLIAGVSGAADVAADAKPAFVRQTTATPSGPATGTLAQPSEVILYSVNGAATLSVSSFGAGFALVSSASGSGGGIFLAALPVSATTSVTPSATLPTSQATTSMVVSLLTGPVTVVPVSDSDTGHGTDAGEAVRVSDADTGHGTDAGEVTRLTVSDSDTGHGTDAAEAVRVPVSDADTGHGTDASEKVTVHDADASAAGADAAERVRVSDADAGHGTDASESVRVPVSDADSGHGTDAGELVRLTVSDADSGHGTDAAEQTRTTVSDADSGHGTDAAEVTHLTVSDADTGHGTDAGELVRLTVTDSDTGHGTDASEKVTLASSDTGTGADAGELTRRTASDADTGHGSDAGEAIRAADADTGHGSDAGESVHASAHDSDASAAGADAAEKITVHDADTGHGTDAGEFTRVPGAPPYVAATGLTTGSGTSRTANVSAGTGAGDTLLALVTTQATACTISALTDSKGNVYTLDRSYATAVPLTYAFRSPGATGGPGGGPTAALTTSDTLTATSAAATGNVEILLVGVPGVGALDQLSAIATGTSATIAVSATPAAASETCVTLAANANAGGSPATGTPFTLITTYQTGVNPYNTAAYEQLAAGTGSGVAQNYSATITSAAWRAVMWTFPPSAPKMSTLTDAFPGTAVDTTKWSAFGTTAVSGATLTLTDVANSTNYSGVSSLSKYDLTGSYLLAHLTNGGAQYASTQALIQVAADANNSLALILNNGNLIAQTDIAGTYTSRGSIAWVGATMSWLRIRESGGTCYWDYSADGQTWTNLASLADPFGLNLVQAWIQEGAYTTSDPQSSSQWQSVNLPPVYGSDTGTGADAGEHISLLVSSSDTGTGTDTAVRITVHDSDAGTGADAGESAGPGGIPVSDSDSGTVADAGELISFAVSSSDTGHGTDAGEVVHLAVSSADTGQGTDAGEHVTAHLPDSDAGHGTDAGEVTAQTVHDTDTGHGTDAGEHAGVVVSSSDASAPGADAGEHVAITVHDTDSGHGTDAGEHGTQPPSLEVTSITTEAFSVLRVGVLSPSTGLESAQMYGCRAASLTLDFDVISCMADDDTLWTWLAVHSAQLSVEVGFISFGTLAYLTGTPGASSGHAPTDYYGVPWEVMYSRNLAPVPICVRALARGLDGRPRTFDILLYSCVLAGVTPDTTFAYKNGAAVSYGARAAPASYDETGHPLASPAVGRILSEPGSLQGPIGSLAFAGML